MIPLTWTVPNRRIHVGRKWAGGCHRLGEGIWGVTAHEDRISFLGEMEMLWHEILKATKTVHEFYLLKKNKSPPKKKEKKKNLLG